MDLIDVPNYNNLKLDTQNNIYVLQNNEIIKIIPFNALKFNIGNKILYTGDIINITFYGSTDRYKFTSYVNISEGIIKSNNVEFRKIDILDGYYISCSGMVYSTKSNKLLKQEVDEDGYHRISFNDPRYTHVGIHRLVYKAWKGSIPNGYVVHHQDNQKWNNDYRNLQITTSFLNSRYAAEDGMYKRTFEWSSEIVENVCKMMQDNISVQEIAAVYGIYPTNKRVYKNFRNQLYNFRKHQRSWIDITSKYDFSSYTGDIRPDSKYRKDDIIKMREMYKNGVNIDIIYQKFNKIPRSYLIRILKGEKYKRCI